MFCHYTSSKLSRPYFEFSLLKSFLLYFSAQESLETGKNNAQTSKNDPLVSPPTLLPTPAPETAPVLLGATPKFQLTTQEVSPPTPLPTPAPETAPVLLGATPKFQLATQEKGSNKEKLDDSTPKKG